MPLKVKIYSREEIELSKFNDRTINLYPNEYFVGINATGYVHKTPHFKNAHDRVLNLYFDDVLEDRIKHDKVFDITFHARAFTEIQAKELKEFINAIPDDATLNIYCTKGKSRSPAVAKFVNEQRNTRSSSTLEYYNKHVYDLLCKV